ncbi:hypothetical protein Tco_1319513 [Tanacetum coccineum]
MFHQDQPSSSTYMQQPLPNNNNYNPQPSFNQNYMQQPMPNPEDITDPTIAMNMALVLRQNVGKSGCSECIQNSGCSEWAIVFRDANQIPNGNGNVVATRAKGNAIGNNGNQISKQRQSGTQTDKAPVYDYRRSAENDSNVISEVSSVEQDGGTIEQHFINVEETRAYHESLFHNLAAEVKKVSSVNHKMKETNVELTTKLTRYKNQEKCFEISQEKYDKLERATKFVRDFKSLAKEADESLTKHKALELEIERLLRAVVSPDIISIVQSNSVVDTSNLQTELEQWKYDKISYDKAYNHMQQKVKWLQAQLGDQKGESKDTPCVSNTLDPLSQKLENENMELEF